MQSDSGYGGLGVRGQGSGLKGVQVLGDGACKRPCG